jgi:NADH-quinone oxidoreductase subunit G
MTREKSVRNKLMPTLKLNGKDVEFDAGMTVLQVCEQEGIEIPRFCYHERLEIAGNCRMCLVEVRPGPPKPQASCALPAGDKMEVFTASDMVKRAREGVMEFMLVNHPLDCPICDQGGECDLQDQAFSYGSGKSRYCEDKRAVEEKYMGPIVKATMTRCIHCTRCVRFSEAVAGVPTLGQVGRGQHAEITTYLEQAIDSELSGNLIDLCPVGALTSKPYAFKGRPWELKKTETIDVMDAVGSNIRVDSRGNAVMRVLPRLNEEVNEEWISDKTRYACDGLQRQRLDRPYVRNKEGKLVAASWEEAFDTIKKRLHGISGDRIAALAGNMACTESMVALKELIHALGSYNLDCRQDGARLDATDRAGYLFNTTIAGLEQADVIVLVGANPRVEAPLVNARIRKRFLRGGLKVYNVGNPHDLTYPVEQLGTDATVLEKAARDKHPLMGILKAAKNPVIILGMSALARDDGGDIYDVAKFLAQNTPVIQEGWNGFNVLHTAAARVGGLDVGFVPSNGGRGIVRIIEGIKRDEISALYLLGVDEIDTDYFGKAFVIYQGHHGDIGAQRADVVLPAAAYTEKDATYVNMEGRPQRAVKAVAAPGEAKEDWKIIRALSETLGVTLPFTTLDDVRARMVELAPHLAVLDEVTPATWKAAPLTLRSVVIAKEAFEEVMPNFYMSDPISRVSPTMAACVKEILLPKQKEKGKKVA